MSREVGGHEGRKQGDDPPVVAVFILVLGSWSGNRIWTLLHLAVTAPIFTWPPRSHIFSFYSLPCDTNCADAML